MVTSIMLTTDSTKFQIDRSTITLIRAMGQKAIL